LDIALQLLGVFCGAAGVYAAIRADLVHARIVAEKAYANAERLHVRMDDHVNMHITQGAK
jgi:hypothetical protein